MISKILYTRRCSAVLRFSLLKRRGSRSTQEWREGGDGGGDGDQPIEETPSSAADPSVVPAAESQQIRVKEVSRRRRDMRLIAR